MHGRKHLPQSPNHQLQAYQLPTPDPIRHIPA